MNLESKKEKYYQWLVDHMIDQTDVDSEKITFRFVLEWQRDDLVPIVYKHIEPWSSSSFFYGQVRDYLERKMGVESGIESKIIWEKFLPQLWEKIRRITGYYGGFEVQLGESVNKKDRFINTIIEDLVSKTFFDKWDSCDVEEIHIPGYGIDICYSGIFDKGNYSYPRIKNNFINYCKNVYGISQNEVLENIWNHYKSIIRDKISGGENINESTENEEKQRKYFYFIVDDLVNKTNIVNIRDMKFIEIPSVLMTRYFSGKPHLSRTVPEEFEKYCKDVYGINKGFIYAVWGAYELKIHDKISGGSFLH